MKTESGSASPHDARSLTASLQGRGGEKLWVWDNWSYAISAEERSLPARELSKENEAVELLRSNDCCFVIGVLNAPREYYDGDRGPNQHHFHSRLGTALTTDFRHFVGLHPSALTAQPDESSIWTGTFARASISSQGKPQHLLFYTYRDPNSPFGFSQAVRIAATSNFIDFTRVSGTNSADGRWYEQHTVLSDTAIHAFRGPFPLRFEGQDYLLISAKSTELPRGEIGSRTGGNGVIAVYKLDLRDGSFKAAPTSLCFAGGKPEMEVPSLYWDAENNEHVCATPLIPIATMRGAKRMSEGFLWELLPNQGYSMRRGCEIFASYYVIRRRLPLCWLHARLRTFPPTPMPIDGSPSWAERRLDLTW